MAWSEFGNGWQSSRISFSVDLSPTDRTSPEKRKRSSAANMNYSTEFEFRSLSSCDADETKSLISADELFVDGKILPQIRVPEVQLLSKGTHGSPDSSSPLRSESCSLTKKSGLHNQIKSRSSDIIKKSGLENHACKSAPSPSSRWKKIFKLIDNGDFCPAVKNADQGLNEGVNDAKNSPSGRSRWPFSWSGREKRGSGLFCSLPFSRSKSSVERKSKPSCEASPYRSISLRSESERRIFLSDSKPCGTFSSKREDFKNSQELLHKVKGSHERVVTNSLPKYYGRGSPGRRNERFTVRNSRSVVSASGGSRGMSMRVSPVVNMPALGMGSFGGRKKGSGIFGFVSGNYRKPRMKNS